MMTVRFPNGFSIQYNTATFAKCHNNGWTDLYTKEGGDWIAQVPTGQALIDAAKACRVYNPLTERTNEKLELMAKEIRLLKRKIKKGYPW